MLVLWLGWTLVMVATAAAVAYFLARFRSLSAAARDRARLAEQQTSLAWEQRISEAREQAGEESGRRKAMDEFLSGLRVEERPCQRGTHGPVVLRERLVFRSLPVSGWTEQRLSEYAAPAATPVARYRQQGGQVIEVLPATGYLRGTH